MATDHETDTAEDEAMTVVPVNDDGLCGPCEAGQHWRCDGEPCACQAEAQPDGAGGEVWVAPPIPVELCGVGGCSLLAGHVYTQAGGLDAAHSWER